MGKTPGCLWGTSDEGTGAIGPEGMLSDGYPTGYEAFYCMRHEATRGQFVDFLNTISSEAYAGTTGGDSSHAGGTYTAAGRYALSGVWPNLAAARPNQACNLLSWWDAAMFAAWAGLRPMTELEYEKASRGPLKPVPDAFAWGTARIAQTEYTVASEGQADEHILGNVATSVGNANYDITMPAYYGGPARGGVSVVPGSPMRAGIFATPGSGRVAAGASYWGILDLSGNVREQVVTVGQLKGRTFEGTHGAGTLAVPDDWPSTQDAVGSGLRGGFFGDMQFNLRTSDRSRAVYRKRGASWNPQGRADENGLRCVRTAP
jgi:hypothetical protein